LSLKAKRWRKEKMKREKVATIAAILLAGILLAGAVGMASAHFTMIFPRDSEDTVWDVTPEDYIAELGDTKTVYILWGHPYKHISFIWHQYPKSQS